MTKTETRLLQLLKITNQLLLRVALRSSDAQDIKEQISANLDAIDFFLQDSQDRN